MSKSLRDKELFLVFCGKDYTIPFSKGLGAFTKVNRNIKHFSVYHTYQLILRIADLEMKSAENTVTGAGLGRTEKRTYYKTTEVTKSDWLFLVIGVIIYIIIVMILVKYDLFKLNFASIK